MRIVRTLLTASLLFAVSATTASIAHAIPCQKFSAEGTYVIMDQTFQLIFAHCEAATLFSPELGIGYDFILDGKTRSTLPQELYEWRKKIAPEKNEPDLSYLEKLTYVSTLQDDDDGASIHLKIEAIVKPRNSKKIRRIHIKGKAAIYLRKFKKMTDCYDCKNQGMFEKKNYIQLWLGNAEITNIEGGTKAEAEAALIDTISKNRHYSNLIPMHDKKSGKPYMSIGDLIFVENYKQTDVDQAIKAIPLPLPGVSPETKPILIEPAKNPDGTPIKIDKDKILKQLNQRSK